MRVCKNCGQEIAWMRKPDGKYIPVDPEPVFVFEGKGDKRFYDDELGEIIGRQALPEEVWTEEVKMGAVVGFVPHWRTCPCKGDFRRRKGE